MTTIFKECLCIQPQGPDAVLGTADREVGMKSPLSWNLELRRRRQISTQAHINAIWSTVGSHQGSVKEGVVLSTVLLVHRVITVTDE